MTGFDDRDGYGAEENGAEEYAAEERGAEENWAEENGAEENGAEARELFARTVPGAEDRRRLAFTAEDLVLGGRRRVRRRRAGAALAGTASLAAVAVAVTAFNVGGVVSPGSDSSPALRDAKRANAVIAKLYSELDPGGHHLTMPSPDRSVDFFLKTGGANSCDAQSQTPPSYNYTETWTADGKAAFPRNDGNTTPWIQISVTIRAPGGQAGQFRSSSGWGPKVQATLTDGSTVATSSASSGHALEATRTFSDNRQVIVTVFDGSSQQRIESTPVAQPTEPFPYTEQQLGRIVGGLGLPLPFADGYRPCGAGGQ
ncbi:hypothetical protein [Catenulispora rubra]|uniref:hypothetical protein n=1 Tax=Catenulispora rubra TaxID=280293 RepID=UPI0018920853|nr:hypothetical protein [Catenulispora rubra]